MRNCAQSLLEHAVFLAIVIAALVLLGYYLRNSFSGKFREGADIAGQGEVYEPFGETAVSTSIENTEKE